MEGLNHGVAPAARHPSIDNITVAKEKPSTAEITETQNTSDLDPEKELPDQDAQKGVKRAEAVSIVWSKTSMRIVFCS